MQVLQLKLERILEYYDESAGNKDEKPLTWKHKGKNCMIMKAGEHMVMLGGPMGRKAQLLFSRDHVLNLANYATTRFCMSLLATLVRDEGALRVPACRTDCPALEGDTSYRTMKPSERPPTLGEVLNPIQMFMQLLNVDATFLADQHE